MGQVRQSRFLVRLGMTETSAAVVLWIFTGIHNAWDSVAYHVFVNRRSEDEKTCTGVQRGHERRAS